MSVDELNRQRPFRLDVPEVEPERFDGEQVHRYGIARKCIHRQYVEVLVRFPLQR